MDQEPYGNRLPAWFHRGNWAGGALACWAIGAYPLWHWGWNIPTGLWALFWLIMGAGAANNARLGLNSIHVPARFRRK
ncbi:MAG: hypothetical protein VX252_17490 [Myxococcota bacterium]|nr:hypothetical protein [Myxococcota bacterium]